MAGELRRVLRPIHLWAIAVGLVISGDYFGWNYGLEKGGPLGLMIATAIITTMYVCFIFGYTELATAIPHSGGPYAFARRALGPIAGYVAGFATVVEFVFAPPAIARAIGAYVHFRVPSLSVNAVAIGAFVVFGIVNVLGVGVAATFELVVTAIATFELLLFFSLTGPHVSTARLFEDPLPHGVAGVFAALPFAIWFYLGMEGVAMSAEETLNPKRDIPKGYVAGILTLVVLATGTLTCTSGVLSWRELVKDDSPLPKALAEVLSAGHPMTHLLVYLGLLGLVASFHGIMMGYSRQVFALAREAYLPRFLSWVHPRLRTPVWAVIVPGVLGAGMVLTERTDELITLSVLGAVVVYGVSTVSLFVLRKKEPGLDRPFVTPAYPLFPIVALGIAVVAFLAVAASAPRMVGVFLGMLLLGGLHFQFVTRPRLR